MIGMQLDMKTDPNWIGGEQNKEEEVEKLDDAAKGVDGDEKESVGFEEGVEEPQGGAEECY